MLPAKFSGFASRVSRLALRALSWHKISERDAALNATSSATSGATVSVSSSNSDASNSVCNFADSDSSFRTARFRTARPARTFRRSLFAMLVASATLFATFVVSPARNANATQAWWDYAGNGYFTDGNFWVGDAVRDISITYPNIEYNQWDSDYGKSGTKISWDIVFNQESIGFASAVLKQLPHGNQPKDGASWEGKPLFIVFLPKGLRDGDRNHKSSVYITRTKTVRSFDNKLHKFVFTNEVMHNHQRPAEFATGRNYSYADGDKDFQTVWNATFGKYGEKATCGDPDIMKNYGFCEIRKWRGSPHNPNDPSNKFGRVLSDWGQADTTYGYKWHIEAFVEDGVNPETLPIIAGWNSNGTLSSWGSGTRNKWAAMGPYDTDGDGIPDYVEHQVKMNPTNGDEISYPQYNNSDDKKYGQDNIPITTYQRPVTVKPFARTGEWEGNSSEGSFEYDGGTTTNLPTNLGIKYELTKNIPKGVIVVNSPSNMPDGSVYIDSRTGHVTYNPRKEDKGRVLEFGTKITYPNPSRYPYNCKYYDRGSFTTEQHPTKIKVVSQASLYNPHYETTEVDSDPSKGTFSPATSVEPKSVRDRKKPWVRVGSLPKGSTFKLEKYGKNGSSVLSWSKIDSKNTGNGKVTFSPPKSEAGKSEKTPVLVTYPDGSTSKDKDSGNSGNPVYAPVTVGDLPISGGDLNLGLYDGTSINNNGFWGFSFRSKTNPHEIDKGKKMGLPDKDNNNPNKGIVFDSWANNGKGPITFRVICHRTDVPNSPYALLKPAEGKEKASGEINGLHFEDFRQWIRDNDKKCKGKDCRNDNYYLHPGEYNTNTMERSRAMIGGTPREGGSYECKVFAFHENDESKKYTALSQFDGLAASGAAMQFVYDASDPAKKTKGSEWVASSFYFKIKLKDNQKYNPTYVKMPTIQAGKSIKDGRYSSPTKDSISTDHPVSTKAGNGVPDKERASILDDYLPDGTWFEIKKLIKKVNNKDSKDFPKESVLWSRFEDGEDNVKRDDKGNPVKDKQGKVVPLNQDDRDYGSVTFHPDKWQSAGEYWAEVRVHYPDGSVSDGEGAVNEKHPVYAKVTVTPKPDSNKFGLNLFRFTTDSQYRTISVENGINLHPGDLLSGNGIPKFDAYLTNAVGNLHEHMICSRQGNDGKQIDYTYGILPGHVNNENSQNENEKDGLRLLEPQTIWKHSSLKDQLECNANGKKCKSDTYLYDDWVDGDKSRDTFERTHAFFVGKAQKTGDYVCKVYVIKGDAESNKFESAVKANIKSKKDEDPVISVLNAKGNPYGTEGVGYKTGAFSVHIHKDNQLYNPTYTKIPEIQAGSTFDKNLKNNKAAISSGAPQSNNKTSKNSGGKEVGANGVPKEDLVNVKEGALPAGTWYEIKRFVKASDITNSKASSLPWANFEDGEDNKADGKQEAKDSNATGKGSVTFRPSKWQDADEYWAEIRVHYPDGSVSDGDDSINKDHPIYARVKVTRPTVGRGDLHLNVYKQYENGKFTGYVDDVNGITVMKGVGLLKDMGIDSWSTAKPEGITLRALCRDDSDEAKKSTTHIWSENLDNLFFKLNWQQAWKYPTFARQETCRKGSNNGDGCNTGDEHFLFDSTGGTMERARGTITSDKAPTKSGKYYCVVLAMKLTDLGKYKNAIKNSKISVTNNDFAKAMGFTDTEGIDYTAKYFPVNVVEPFKLPKTGGEGMSMALLVVAMIGMCVMCGAFFVDQTKWGHAMLAGAAAGMMCGLRSATRNTNSKISKIWRGLVKKVKDIRRFDDYSASAKDFVRKATGWLRAAFRRVRRWATERWRC